MIKPLKFPEDKLGNCLTDMWVEKDFLRIKTMNDDKNKADECNYTKIKITCTLNIRVIHYITPSYSPSNKIIIIDVAKHTECVVCAQNCFNLLLCTYLFM